MQTDIANKITSLFQATFFSGIVITMFSMSLVSHGVLDHNFMSSIPSPVMSLHEDVKEFSLTNPYGLFRR